MGLFEISIAPSKAKPKGSNNKVEGDCLGT